jgi:hypothetical protein
VRITGLVRATSYGISFWEVDVLGPDDAQPVPVDLARGKSTAASSDHDASFVSSRAVDADASTRWSSRFTDGQWWQVDLGSQQQVGRVVVDWERAYASRYRISTSTDGTTFTTAADVTNGEPGPKLTTFAARSARWVRVTGLTRATVYGISFWEASVYGP